jgi:hypothetical protein
VKCHSIEQAGHALPQERLAELRNAAALTVATMEARNEHSRGN